MVERDVLTKFGLGDLLGASIFKIHTLFMTRGKLKERFFFEKRFVGMALISPSGTYDEAAPTVVDEESVPPIIDMGSAYRLGVEGVDLANCLYPWPENISRGMEYLQANDYQTLLVVCKETFDGVVRVLGEDIFEQIDRAQEKLMDGDDPEGAEKALKWLERTGRTVHALSSEKASDVLKLLAKEDDADNYYRQELVAALTVNAHLDSRLRETVAEKEDMREQMDATNDRSFRLQKKIIRTQQRGENDQLTGAPKKRAMYFDLYQKMCDVLKANQLGENRSIHVVAFDLDRFKQVNDAGVMGHLGGDMVLQTVVRVIQEVLGSLGMLWRYGGEEFVLMVETDDITTFMNKVHSRVYQEVVCQLDPNKMKFGYKMMQGVKNAFSGIGKAIGAAFDWTKPFMFRGERQVDPLLPDVGNNKQLVSYHDEGIVFGNSSASFDAVPAAVEGNAIPRHITLSAGVVKYPANDEAEMPLWDKLAVYLKYRDILGSLRDSYDIDWGEIAGDRELAEQLYASSVPKHSLREDIVGVMAYLLVAADRASYSAKLSGRNASFMIDGTSENVRDGHKIASCKEAPTKI